MVKPQRVTFIHIPKCAGISVSTALRRICRKNRIVFRHHNHATPAEIPPRYHVHATYTVAVVRHPADRFLSAFSFVKHLPRTHRWWAYNLRYRRMLVPYRTFHRFALLAPLDRFKKFLYWRPQVEWIDGIDFVLRYETLDADWLRLLRELNVPAVPLPRMNTSDHLPWWTCYTPRMWRRLVGAYREDFEALKYPATLPRD